MSAASSTPAAKAAPAAPFNTQTPVPRSLAPAAEEESSNSSDEESSKSDEDDVSDEDDINAWEPSFGPAQQTAVAAVAPSLMLLKNPFPWFVVVIAATVGISAYAATRFATTCDFTESETHHSFFSGYMGPQ